VTLLPNYMTVEVFSIYAYLYTIYNSIFALATMNTTDGLFYLIAKNNDVNKRIVTYSLYQLFILIGVVLVSLFFLSNDNKIVPILLILGSLYSYTYSAKSIITVICDALGNNKYNDTLKIVISILNVFLLFIWVFHTNKSLVYLYSVFIFTFIIYISLILRKIKVLTHIRNIKFKDILVLKELFIFVLPLVIYSAIKSLLVLFDALWLKYSWSILEMPIYLIGLQITTPFVLLISTALPFIQRKLIRIQDNKYEKICLYKHSIGIYCVASVYAFFILSNLCNEISIYVFQSKYEALSEIIFYSAILIISESLFQLLSIFLMAAKQYKLFAIASLKAYGIGFFISVILVTNKFPYSDISLLGLGSQGLIIKNIITNFLAVIFIVKEIKVITTRDIAIFVLGGLAYLFINCLLAYKLGAFIDSIYIILALATVINLCLGLYICKYIIKYDNILNIFK
jgi:O-antigen/teichoic acid export membrane protein